MTSSRIYLGDAREVLPELLDEYAGKIALLVTSPPYFIGREYEDYIKSEQEYWDMIESVLTHTEFLMEWGGKVAINFADRYANAKNYGRPLEISYLPYYDYIMGGLHCDLWARIIWDKVRVMIDGARHTTNKGRFTGSMRVAPNWEYIFVWRKYIKGMKAPKKELDMTKEEWREWVNGIWRFSSVTRNAKVGGTKLAMFPTELPHRLIKMYTQPGDIVLDPFVGTGTTVKAAISLGRMGIGIDKNREMEGLLREHLPGVEIIK